MKHLTIDIHYYLLRHQQQSRLLFLTRPLARETRCSCGRTWLTNT